MDSVEFAIRSSVSQSWCECVLTDACFHTNSSKTEPRNKHTDCVVPYQTRLQRSGQLNQMSVNIVNNRSNESELDVINIVGQWYQCLFL